MWRDQLDALPNWLTLCNEFILSSYRVYTWFIWIILYDVRSPSANRWTMLIHLLWPRQISICKLRENQVFHWTKKSDSSQIQTGIRAKQQFAVKNKIKTSHWVINIDRTFPDGGHLMNGRFVFKAEYYPLVSVYWTLNCSEPNPLNSKLLKFGIRTVGIARHGHPNEN